MTIKEYMATLDELGYEYATKAFDSIVVPNANELLATIKNRILNEGENSSGGKMKPYDTTPAYYGPSQFVKKSSFAAKGKTGEKVFKNGNPHKTEYFPSGYKGLRDKQGRRTDITNMSYTGSTMLAYQLGERGNAAVLGFVNNEASKIRKGQEQKRGKIFYAQQSEIDTYNRNVLTETEALTRKLLK